MSGSLIAEIFTASHRGVANGIFSWGVYYGYGLAFVFGKLIICRSRRKSRANIDIISPAGIYITKADILGYGWRAPYVLASVPGLLVAVLILLTFK